MTPRYPREMLNNPGFVVCPGAELPALVHKAKGYKDGVETEIEVIVCTECERIFGSVDYFEEHGTFKGRKEGEQ